MKRHFVLLSVTISILVLGLVCPSALAWEKDGLRLRGRLIGRYDIRDEDRKFGRWTDTISVHRARFDGRWDVNDKLSLSLEFDLADGFEMEDAFVRYEFHQAFRLTVGHMKKPFSRRRLTRRWDLLIPRRGILDRHVVGRSLFGGYAGRDMGIMLSGRVGKSVRFRYFLGAFDGQTVQNAFNIDPADPEDPNSSHRDYVARLQLRLFKGFVIAASYNHKRASIILAPGEETDRSFNMFGGDIRFRIGGFCIVLEGIYGDNPNAIAGHKVFGGHGVLSYRIQINDDIAITPAFMAEFMDPDDTVDEGHGIRLAGALNLDVGQHMRFILSAEGGSGEYTWEAPEYITPEQAIAIGMTPREIPTRIILQINVSI